MRVTPILDHGIDFLASDLVRSPGLHASDIYGDLFKQLEPKRYDIRDKDTGEPIALNPVLMALGTAWEKHFEYLLGKAGIVVHRPEEFMAPPPDNVAFSPDLIQFNGVTRLWEIKYTSMSVKDLPVVETNSLPPKFDKYDCQMKLYAYWLGINDGTLAVVLNHQPWDPQFRMFNVTWNKRELADNHTMLMNYAKHKGLLK
jgi:hypothetical protein